MTALLSLLVVVVAFAYAVHRFAPRSGATAFRIDRFRAPWPLLDDSASYYEEQRQYADIAAIRSRSEAAEVAAEPIREAERAVVRSASNPSCGTFKASFS
ncbi:hypothetical protein OG225_31940 [Nocardia sp. NBC_01377]|uniref:hypothetical protein n=1 Tax=Nocardia sp. NBC_01377 TaxID=2903595 RepID=UPI00324E347F